MARIEDPETRRFVREATVGMIVVAGLLSLIIVGVARRFGAWDRTPPASDVQAAQIYKRAPAGGREEVEPERVATVPDEPVVSRPRNQGTSPQNSTPPASSPISVSPVGQPTQQRSPSPAALPSANRQWPRESPVSSGTSPSITPARPSDNNASEHRGEGSKPSEVPTPFRPTPAVATGQSTPQPSSPDSPRDNQALPNPNWTIRVDDTLWIFCERNYGDPQWFRAFHAWLAAQGLVFEDLGPGRVLKPPTKSELRSRYPNLAPQIRESGNQNSSESRTDEDDRLYVTQGHESLFDIAARSLGQAARYVELVELNEDRIPAETDYLSPLPKGLRLQLPPR